MAEAGKEAGKGVTAGKLASSMQKRLTRAQEKVLQKLGKADETRDSAFEEGVANFNKQMVEGARLQKDLRTYLTAVKMMHEASKRLQDCLAEMYEPDWFGKEEVDSIAEDTDMLWIDFHQKLVDASLISMDSYMAQFPDIKNRIAKRDRKLVDFDSARHHVASIQKGKKKDEVKIAKPVAILQTAAPGWAQGLIAAHQVAQTNLNRNQAEEELGRAQKVFDEINADLQEELPTLWNSRVGFYVTTFQSIGGVTEKFHKEMGKLSLNLNDVMGKLEDQRNIKQDTKTKTPAKSEAATNHSAESDSTPKSPPKSRRPSVPPAPRPPRPSPAAEVPQESAPALFGDTTTAPMTTPSPTPDAAVPPPSQPQQPQQPQQAEDEAVQPSWDDQGTQGQTWEDQGTANDQQPSWDDEGTQGQTWGNPGQDQAYDQQTWDDSAGGQDNTQTQASWGDEGTQGQTWDDQATASDQQTWEESTGGQDHTQTQAGWAGGQDLTQTQAGWGDQGQSGWAESEPPQWEGEEPQSPEAAAASGAESNAVTNGASESGDLPPGVVYKVKALHDYAATDGDELEMKSGDVVLVLAFDSPDEQDEGWLMGVLESHWLANHNLSARGVFPENFTQRC